MMTRPCALAGVTVLLGLLATQARATPIEPTLIATGGDVVVTFESTGAGYTSYLFLDGPAGDGIGVIFNTWTTELGTAVSLGSFDAGTELVFKLLVWPTADVFYTGAASRNLDGLVHARVESRAGRVFVGFEDIYGGGDLDYDDLVFAFVNVRAGIDPGVDLGDTPGTPAAVDEPATLMLLGSGLAMLGVVIRRQKSQGIRR
jgi:hypothetical protein